MNKTLVLSLLIGVVFNNTVLFGMEQDHDFSLKKGSAFCLKEICIQDILKNIIDEKTRQEEVDKFIANPEKYCQQFDLLPSDLREALAIKLINKFKVPTQIFEKLITLKHQSLNKDDIGTVNKIVFNKQVTYAAVTSLFSDAVFIYNCVDMNNIQFVAKLQNPNPGGGILSIGFNKQGSIFVSIFSNNSLCFYTCKNDKIDLIKTLPNNFYGITSICFDNKRNIFAYASGQDVFIYDYSDVNLTLINQFKDTNLKNAINSISFDKDGSILAIGAGHQIVFYDCSDLAQINFITLIEESFSIGRTNFIAPQIIIDKQKSVTIKEKSHLGSYDLELSLYKKFLGLIGKEENITPQRALFLIYCLQNEKPLDWNNSQDSILKSIFDSLDGKLKLLLIEMGYIEFHHEFSKKILLTAKACS